LSRTRTLRNVALLQNQYPEYEVIPVLKGNTYGHGLREMAEILNGATCKFIAVDGYFEAAMLRDISRHDLLVMGLSPACPAALSASSLPRRLADVRKCARLVSMEERAQEDASHLGWWQVVVLAATLLCFVWGTANLLFMSAAPPAAVVRIPAAPPRRMVQGAAAPVDCARVDCLALTFDDGPNPVVTPQVLDILERHHARATFFVIGLHVPGNEALVRRMHGAGNEIGNHSWAHPDFTTLNPQQIQEQIDQTQAVVAAAGVPVPTLFRPPYGAVNAQVKNNVPLVIALWNVDPEDWDTGDAKKIITKVEATAKPGGVVEMHDIHQQTADALDQLLNDLGPRYQFVTVSEMFNLPRGQRGVYFGR
jgi:peptidoglycan/xylan/chitin deacetylase (PgdA/CDA1 family)